MLAVRFWHFGATRPSSSGCDPRPPNSNRTNTTTTTAGPQFGPGNYPRSKSTTTTNHRTYSFHIFKPKNQKNHRCRSVLPRQITHSISFMCKLMSVLGVLQGAAVNHPSFQLFPIHPVMATFYANPNDTNEPWIEKSAFNGFRNWHVMFFCFSGLTTLGKWNPNPFRTHEFIAVILICCCVKFRIPRTKQEIEGDYRRKKLAEKFQERLRMIQNHDMDVLDLQQGNCN